jgi:hypothetical protein
MAGDSGPAAAQASLEGRHADRDNATRCRFVAGEQDLEIEGLDPLGLWDVPAREVTQKPVANLGEGRVDRFRRLEDRDRLPRYHARVERELALYARLRDGSDSTP